MRLILLLVNFQLIDSSLDLNLNIIQLGGNPFGYDFDSNVIMSSKMGYFRVSHAGYHWVN